MIDPTQPGVQAQEMPSEANLMMALAEMHKQGRFAQGDGKPPVIDFEQELKDQRSMVGTSRDADEVFGNLYKQLEGLNDKVSPGNLLRMYDKKGNDFYYQRDDNFENGFKWHPKPPDKVAGDIIDN